MARETQGDPIDVDTDRASFGWTNWEVDNQSKAHVEVKRERNVFQSLRSTADHVIDLSTPSPSPKRKKTSGAAIVENPDHVTLGFPADEDEYPELTLREDLENMMDAEDLFAEAEDLPDEADSLHDKFLG